MFYVGQRVKIKDGENTNIGTVTNVSEFLEYPIVVTYDNGYIEAFTEDGRMYDWNVEVHLFPLEENSTFLQDLKQLLQRYNASIEVNFDRDGDQELVITLDDKPTYIADGSILDLEVVNELIQKP